MAKKANTKPDEVKLPAETPGEIPEAKIPEVEPSQYDWEAKNDSIPDTEEPAVPDPYETVELAPELSDVDISSLPGCPLIGDLVHYIAKGRGERRAAIITKVNEPGNPVSAVSLHVFNPKRDYIKHDVPYSSKPESWQWRRVEVLPIQ